MNENRLATQPSSADFEAIFLVDKRFGLLLLIVFVAVSQVGCVRGDPSICRVSGCVTLDGKPISEGRINFNPVSKAMAPQGGKIVDGSYSFDAKIGMNDVEVMVTGIGPNPTYIDGVPLKTNIIPPRYNEKTELHADVSRERAEFDFDLRSK